MSTTLQKRGISLRSGDGMPSAMTHNDQIRCRLESNNKKGPVELSASGRDTAPEAIVDSDRQEIGALPLAAVDSSLYDAERAQAAALADHTGSGFG